MVSPVTRAVRRDIFYVMAFRRALVTNCLWLFFALVFSSPLEGFPG